MLGHFNGPLVAARLGIHGGEHLENFGFVVLAVTLKLNQAELWTICSMVTEVPGSDWSRIAVRSAAPIELVQ